MIIDHTVCCCFPSRFGYEYFDKLSSSTIKDLFTDDVPNTDVSSSLEKAASRDLGVITLGVNEVCVYCMIWPYL